MGNYAAFSEWFRTTDRTTDFLWKYVMPTLSRPTQTEAVNKTLLRLLEVESLPGEFSEILKEEPGFAIEPIQIPRIS